MQRSNGAKFFPFIIIIVIIALVIAAIVSIGRAIFNSGDSSESEQTTSINRDREELLKTSTGRSVRMTVRGPIVAEEEFTSYQITASNSERSMVVYRGYLEEEVQASRLPNNTQAYEQFVYALDKANFTTIRGDKEQNDEPDLRGICATGYVFEYSVLSGGNEVNKLWTSTCDGSKGTLGASREQVSNLFLEQIPTSSELNPFSRGPQLRL